MSAVRVIAIDGPAGSGKSTVARALAARLGLDYLDTGAMYRGVTFSALRRGIDPSDADGLCSWVEQLYHDTGLRHRLAQQSLARARVFSWEGCVQRTLDAYRSVRNGHCIAIDLIVTGTHGRRTAPPFDQATAQARLQQALGAVRIMR